MVIHTARDNNKLVDAVYYVYIISFDMLGYISFNN